MKMIGKYLNFVFHIEVKTKSTYNILNFVFQFIKNMKWHFGYTDSGRNNLINTWLALLHKQLISKTKHNSPDSIHKCVDELIC